MVSEMKKYEQYSYRVLQVLCLVAALIFLVGGGVSFTLIAGAFLGYGIFGIAANLTKNATS